MKLLTRGVCVCLMVVAFSMITTDVFSQSINISPQDLYFGRIPEGTEAIRKIAVSATSVTPLEVTNIRFEGADAALFSLVNVTFPFTVDLTTGSVPFEVVEIQFEPVGEGPVTAQVIVESNAISGPDRIDLTGEGTDLDAGYVIFERIFGSVYGDGLSSVRILDDGGYLLAGGIRRVDDEDEYGDAMLMKTNVFGEIEWSVLYGIDGESEGFSEAIPTSDGGYIAVGNWREPQGATLRPSDVLVVKFDADRFVEWSDTFGQSDFREDDGSDIVEMTGGGYLVLGTSQSITGDLPHNDAYLIKLDAAGNEVWAEPKLYGGDGGDNGARIKPTSDGNYVFIGSSSTYSTGGATDWDFWLTKIDPDGNEIWHENYGGSNWDYSGSVIETADGGFLMSGNTSSAEFGATEPDALLIKADANGIFQWHKKYGFADFQDGGGEVIATQDGGYFILGRAELDYDEGLEVYYSDIYIIKTDMDGNKEWDQLLGGYHNEGASCVRQTDDGGYIISASTGSYNPLIGHRDNYLLKLDGNGEYTDVCCDGFFTPTEFGLAQNYPNPFNNGTTISYNLSRDSQVRLTVFNLLGQAVEVLVDAHQPAGAHKIRLHADEWMSGLYFYQIEAAGYKETRRMLLMK